MRALARVALIGIALSFCMIYAGRGAKTHASPPSPPPGAAQKPVAADTIIQLAELIPSDGGANDGFGVSVAISGDTIVIGSGGHAVGQNAAQGAAYVFVKPAGGWADTSTFTAELTASDGIASDNFGSSVSISGDTIVVGACNLSGVCSNGPGKAYVFVKPAGGWATTSTFDAELTPSDGGTAQDSFGLPVSIGGDTVVVGSPQTNGVTGIGPGKAYVFVKPAGGWSSMTETAVLTASDGVNNDGFGQPTVSSDGNTVLIGASEATVGGNSQQGAAYIYVKPAERLGDYIQFHREAHRIRRAGLRQFRLLPKFGLPQRRRQHSNRRSAATEFCQWHVCRSRQSLHFCETGERLGHNIELRRGTHKEHRRAERVRVVGGAQQHGR